MEMGESLRSPVAGSGQEGTWRRLWPVVPGSLLLPRDGLPEGAGVFLSSPAVLFIMLPPVPAR